MIVDQEIVVAVSDVKVVESTAGVNNNANGVATDVVDLLDNKDYEPNELLLLLVVAVAM